MTVRNSKAEDEGKAARRPEVNGADKEERWLTVTPRHVVTQPPEEGVADRDEIDRAIHVGVGADVDRYLRR